MSRPGLLGLRHLALWIPSDRFDATSAFYRDGLGMTLQWQPDDDNVYLTHAGDNLALHRASASREIDEKRGALDHLGFFVPTAADVGAWEAEVLAHASEWQVTVVQPTKTHRDGATSFYLRDPAGNLVQILHMPDPDPDPDPALD